MPSRSKGTDVSIAYTRLLGALDDILASAPPLEGLPWPTARQIVLAAEIARVDYSAAANFLTEAESLPDLLACPSDAVLAIGPCPAYVESLIPMLQDAFPALVLVDNLKAGSELHGVSVISSQQLRAQHDVHTLFVPTNDLSIAQLFFDAAEHAQHVTLLDLQLRAASFETEPAAALEEFCCAVEAEENPIIVLCGAPISTLLPTYQALDASGLPVFHVVRSHVETATSYSTLPGSTFEKHRYLAASLPHMLQLLPRLKHARIWFVAESFYHPGWDMKRSIISYAYAAAIASVMGGTKILVLYDAIKPALENLHTAPSAAYAYRAMIAAFDAVIYSSNSSAMGDFSERAMDLKIPRIHFLRYGYATKTRPPKRDANFHIAVITMLLDEIVEPSRNPLKPHVISLLRQGLHVHYYSEHAAARRFHAALPSELAARFHLHNLMLDPIALAADIAQFDAGWAVYDYQVFCSIVAGLDHQLLKDFFSLFPATTMPTSALFCAAAGLPVIINRATRAAVDEISPECCVEIELSEISQISKTLLADDWETRKQIAWKNRERLDITRQIPKLRTFLDQLGPYAKTGSSAP
jgi:hypothetical protein